MSSLWTPVARLVPFKRPSHHLSFCVRPPNPFIFLRKASNHLNVASIDNFPESPSDSDLVSPFSIVSLAALGSHFLQALYLTSSKVQNGNPAGTGPP